MKGNVGMDKLDELSARIADEIMNAPESERADLALQIASSFVEFSGYETARTGVVKSSTRLFLLANEIERMRRAEQAASAAGAGNVLPFVAAGPTRMAAGDFC